MIEITKEQLNNLDSRKRVEILKDIALGFIKYRSEKEEQKLVEDNMNHIPQID